MILEPKLNHNSQSQTTPSRRQDNTKTVTLRPNITQSWSKVWLRATQGLKFSRNRGLSRLGRAKRELSGKTKRKKRHSNPWGWRRKRSSKLILTKLSLLSGQSPRLLRREREAPVSSQGPSQRKSKDHLQQSLRDNKMKEKLKVFCLMSLYTSQTWLSPRNSKMYLNTSTNSRKRPAALSSTKSNLQQRNPLKR